jgi:hypothetical protein
MAYHKVELYHYLKKEIHDIIRVKFYDYLKG